VVRERISDGHTLADAIRLWLTEKDRSRNEKNDIKAFLKAYKSRPLHQVDTNSIRDLYAKKKASTANRTFNNINAALNLAHNNGWCSDLKIPRREEDGAELCFLTKEEWERLEKHLSGHAKSICTFAIYTGLRASNIFGLKWRNVNLDTKTAWVDKTTAKGKKSIGVPLSSKAFEVLTGIEKHGDYVFMYQRGKKNPTYAPVKSIKTALHTAMDKAGIKDFHFHGFRHTFASWHVQGIMTGKPTPLQVLKELGAWESMDMVMIYAHLAPDHLRQWVD
jgi:integrase